MPTCFVIQPFDNGQFDKLFKGVYSPSIIAAGLEPYRVDQDPNTDILIDAIENGIKNAAVCLADITTDNPNVWYELGFAFAARRPVVMVCSADRKGKYPFDIQHRAIVTYVAQSPQDFAQLTSDLTSRLAAAVKRGETLEDLAEQVALTPI